MDLIELNERLGQARILYRADKDYQKRLDESFMANPFAAHKVYVAVCRHLSRLIIDEPNAPVDLAF